MSLLRTVNTQRDVKRISTSIITLIRVVTWSKGGHSFCLQENALVAPLHPPTLVMSFFFFFPGQTSKDLLRKSAAICSRSVITIDMFQQVLIHITRI